MKYCRADNKGGTYFFAVNLADRNKTLLVDHMDILRQVINQVKKQHPFRLESSDEFGFWRAIMVRWDSFLIPTYSSTMDGQNAMRFGHHES